MNKEEYLFASYVPREEIFTAVHRLWQNALLEKVKNDPLFDINASLSIVRQPLRASQMQDLNVTDGTHIDESIGGSESSAVKNNFKDQFPEVTLSRIHLVKLLYVPFDLCETEDRSP